MSKPRQCRTSHCSTSTHQTSVAEGQTWRSVTQLSLIYSNMLNGFLVIGFQYVSDLQMKTFVVLTYQFSLNISVFIEHINLTLVPH